MAIEGIDVSNNNGFIAWPKVKAAGDEYSYMKVSQGNYFTDAYFAQNYAGAKAAGVIPGAYLYWRPDISPAAQVQYFARLYGKWKAGDLPPALDVELNDGEMPGYTVQQLVAHVAESLTLLEQACGKKPVLYTYPYFWQTRMGNSTQFSSYPLWIAGYPNVPVNIGGWKDNTGKTTYTIHQYADRGAAYAGGPSVDHNHFNGTLADLQNFAGLGGVPADQPLMLPGAKFPISHGFKDFYLSHPDGFSLFGMPLTGEIAKKLSDGKTYTVQYFERARFEWHPELNPGQVLLGLIGSELMALGG